MLGFYYWDLKNESECRSYVRENSATTGPVLDFALDSVAYQIPYASAIQKACARDRDKWKQGLSSLAFLAIGSNILCLVHKLYPKELLP